MIFLILANGWGLNIKQIEWNRRQFLFQIQDCVIVKSLPEVERSPVNLLILDVESLMPTKEFLENVFFKVNINPSNIGICVNVFVFVFVFVFVIGQQSLACRKNPLHL
jgi:hypothetical protein